MVRVDDINAWEYLRDLDIPVATDEQVQILTGQDQPDVLMSLEARAAREPEAPYAIIRLFGWTASGPLSEDSTSPKHTKVSFISLDQVGQFRAVEGVPSHRQLRRVIEQRTKEPWKSWEKPLR